MLFVIFIIFLAISAKADLIDDCVNYTIYPLQYELTIVPYIFKDSSYYHCDITIDVIVNAPDIRVIELDAKDLEIREGSIKVFYENVDIVNGARPFEYDERNGKLYIHLREPLRMYDVRNNAQFVYKIQMSFTKYLTEDTSGIFLVKYFDEESREYKYIYTTRFSPNKAKYAFPCFDNPRFESGFKFKVYVLPQRSDMQYTNTSLVIADVLKKESNNNYLTIHYMPSPQVALHQVGIHFSQFGSIQKIAPITNDTLAIWAPLDELKRYYYTLNYGITIIELIHEFSGTRRPLLNGPINLVAVPKNLDGYEISSWNLLTHSGSKLANLEKYSSIKQIERMEFELAQQLSRIWLGNPGETQVTRWKEEWFKEGMATYIAYYLLSQYNHGVRTNQNRPLSSYGLQMKQKAMGSDWHHTVPALITFNRTLAVEIPPRYKELVTMKTGAIWWMLENWLMPNQLHDSFVKHINAMRGQDISIWDLMKAIDKDTIECTYQFFNGSTPTRILQSWFRQSGYPVVNVNVLRDRIPNAIQLKQRHFSFSPRNREPSDYLIPISYLVESNSNCFNCYQPRFTIGGQTYTFGENLNGGWIVLNRKASGYYRVNYDEQTWRLIAKSLKHDPENIDQMNRAQIVNDVFALYMAGDMDRLLAEEILDYLEKERNPTVWDAVIDGFNILRIDGATMHMTKSIFWEWEEFMSKKVDQIFNILVKSIKRDPETRLFRNNIINFAAEINHEPCLAYLRNVHEGYRTGRLSLDPDIREAMYYMFENSTHYHFVSKTLNPVEKEDKLSAEHKVRERNRFIMRCPYGEPRPLPIISTEMPPNLAVTEKLEVTTIFPSSSNKLTTTSSLFLAFILLYFII